MIEKMKYLDNIQIKPVVLLALKTKMKALCYNK